MVSLHLPLTGKAPLCPAKPGKPLRLAGCERRSASCRTVVAAAGPSGGFASLEDWLVSCGGVVEGVRLAGAGASRGLVATADLQPGQRLISVPASCQVRHDQVPDARLLALFDRVPKGAPPTMAPATAHPGGRGGNGLAGTEQGSAWQFKQALLLLWHLVRSPRLAPAAGAAMALRLPPRSAGHNGSGGGGANSAAAVSSSSPLEPYLAQLPGIAPGAPTPLIGMCMSDAAVEQLQYVLACFRLNRQQWC